MPPPSRRLHAPAADGAVLADPHFAAIPALVEENRRRLNRDDVVIGGLPLRELRALARREVLEVASGRREPAVPDLASGRREPAVPDLASGRREPAVPDLASGRREPAVPARFEQPAHAGRSPDTPLLIAGHQPELSHPGVWVKNFALSGLARKLGGISLNLIVDTDTLKSTSLRFPVLAERGPEGIRLESVPFDRLDTQEPYTDRGVHDTARFEGFADRAAGLWARWGFEPLLAHVWPEVVAHAARTIGKKFTGARHEWERRWGCHNLELPVSRLAETNAFAAFARHILGDLPRFREAYNAAIRAYREANDVRSLNHPAPELGPDEAPFWVRTAAGRRERAKPASGLESLRPRALTLTLFARVCLGDFFIHGIGGGKYDEVTDAIIRDYFGVEPPAYQVLSATLHLPLPGFPATAADLERAERRVRDLTWNPQDVLPPMLPAVRRKASLVAAEPPRGERASRREWFRELHDLTEQMRPLVVGSLANAEADRERVRAEVRANAVLRRRDYSWVLYPEETLRPFLQRFLGK